MNKSCETCIFWQDYHDRVYANISKTRGDLGDNSIELRRCRWQSPPGITMNFSSRYTDKEYGCSEHEAKTHSQE